MRSVFRQDVNRILEWLLHRRAVVLSRDEGGPEAKELSLA